MTTEPAIVVREARPADLTAVAAVFLACWRDSYPSVLPPDVVGMYDEDAALALWRPALCCPRADAVVLVAEQTGRGILGIIRIGKDPDAPRTGHVFSLYVRPEAQGLGVGTRLLAVADDRFRDEGAHEATLWVFEANSAARRFYSSLGWRPDGAKRVEPQFGEPEVRLRRTPGGGVA